jgi:hypothetical protein
MSTWVLVNRTTGALVKGRPAASRISPPSIEGWPLGDSINKRAHTPATVAQKPIAIGRGSSSRADSCGLAPLTVSISSKPQ